MVYAAPSDPYIDLDANFGPAFAGLSTIGVRILDTSGSAILARTTTGVSEAPTASGLYAYRLASSGIPQTLAKYRVVWDTGTPFLQYAVEDLVITTTPTIIFSGGGSTNGQPYTPAVFTGPDGSPNGALEARPGTIVTTSSGEIFIKTTGQSNEGWTQTQ